ncbi:DUF2262 domain-containing protein [Isobaculum melis]|uniref:DUF2262 domain-containing protein n=1 Tax=Isobaculum melis TaxID=142588 RepID=A0A1H9TCX3_9LACT|nr:DUF2262 domain-containing protein [Isobaculum melis]SER94877.1 hypothetical protein SAMN04488559_11240 [Isobaculum melis]
MKTYTIITGFGYLYRNPSENTIAGMEYTAYHAENEPLTAKSGTILFLSTVDTFENLKEKVLKNSMIRIIGEKDGETIFIHQLLDAAPTPNQEEQLFLEKQTLPRDFEDAILGNFKENRALNYFEGKMQHHGEEISVALQNKKELPIAHQIYEQLDLLLAQARSFAAEELCYDANEWNYSDWIDEGKDKADFVELTEEAFCQDLTPTTFSIWEEKNYQIWFNTGDLFTDHAICVYANLNDGCLSANIEG